MAGKSIRRIVLIGLLLSLGTIPRAEASPFLVTMGGQFDVGPLAGTAFTASYYFNAPVASSPFGFAEGVWPLSLLLLNVQGTQVVTQPNPGLNFYLQGGGNLFGPNWSLPAQSLPAGINSWNFSFIPQVWVTYTDPACATGGSNCVAFGRFTNSAITQSAPNTIPEPTSLLLGLGAVAGLALRRRRGAGGRAHTCV